MDESLLVRFQPLSTHINPSFWHDLSTLKLNHLHLSEDPIPLQAAYSTGKLIRDRVTGKDVSIACNVTLDKLDAAGGPSEGDSASHRYVGHIINFNTIEAFRTFDKSAYLAERSQALATFLLEAPLDGAADLDALLNPFFVLTYSDLKKYKFYYWAAFPALVAKPAWQLKPSSGGDGGVPTWSPAKEALGGAVYSSLSEAINQRRAVPGSGSYLLARITASSVHTESLLSYSSFFEGVPAGEQCLVFLDPSSAPSTPGWPLRNALAFLSVRFQMRSIRVIAWRDETGAADSRSIVADLTLGSGDVAEGCVKHGEVTLPIAALANAPTAPSAVGWERNAAGKLAPKVADLGGSMDPRRLADQAVDLNLKLMRWRIMPDINLEKIQGTRCLLLGAGTLGCYVSRVLLGWGVRKITLLDSSRVSFSNPVRQPLFDFNDCLDGGAPKAACAAEKLRKIYPGVESEGVHMSIPMPGHPIDAGTEDKVRADVEQLEILIAEHDVVYLLMDSRESRWLPTLLGAAKGKLVINAALGFDTYLVMRHGAGPDSKIQQPSDKVSAGIPLPERLGCYFCNDVVAPADSLTDRTLDQMCTVTRPGLAAIAGASAVELMVSVVQHKDGVRAPAVASPPRSSTSDIQSIAASLNASVPFGVLPHQLRGGLSTFSTHLVVGSAYERCTACSPTVISEWDKGGFDMLRKVCGEEGWLERLTGLDKVQEDARKAAEEMEAFDLDDDEEGAWGEEEGGGDGELL